MKTCDNCANKDWCLITRPDTYYEILIFNGASVCSKYKEKETDMKSCENCLINNTCVDYYAKNGNSQICEWYTEVKDETHFCDECQDYANCDLVDHNKERGGKCCGDFREAESDAKIHGETQKKYRVDIYYDNVGCGSIKNVVRNAARIKIINLNAVSLLNIISEDGCRYSYNLAMAMGFEVTEE